MDVRNREVSYSRSLLSQDEGDSEPDSDLPYLEGSRHQLLVEWNSTQINYPQDSCIHELFEAQVVRFPDAIAVTFEEKQLTYRELNARANQLAHYLRTLGVGPEVLVGICIERSLEMVVGLLGILKAGGAYVPLDSAYPLERLAFMLEDAQVPVLLTQERLLEELPSYWAQVVCLDADWESIAQESEENPAIRTTADNLAYVIYTSGSTGKPKGVEIQQSGLVNLVTWHQRVYNVMPVDRATQLAGPAFDASIWELWPYLTAGASIHIPGEATRVSPSKLWNWLAKLAITICFLPTPLAEAMLEQQLPKDLALRALLTGGDKLHRSPRQALPFCLFNHYGPTENTVVTTWAPVAAGIESEAPPPIGRPIANTQIYLLDSKIQLVPIGVSGELHIGGVGLARGYLNRPELTAEKFIANPFSNKPGARLYKTGDLARYLTDGNIEFLGRIDHQVKLRGFRIELGEIETVLGKHPNVREVIVLAREDEPGKLRLVAYIVTDQRSTPTSEFRRFLEEHLPDYMVPSAFVMLESLPLSPNGKVDRRALPVPERVKTVQETYPSGCSEYVAPRTRVEEVLVRIWTEILGVKQVGIYDNFFELGGHSIAAGQLIARLYQAFQVELSLDSFFEVSNIAELAVAIEEIFLREMEELSEDEAELLVEGET